MLGPYHDVLTSGGIRVAQGEQRLRPIVLGMVTVIALLEDAVRMSAGIANERSSDCHHVASLPFIFKSIGVGVLMWNCGSVSLNPFLNCSYGFAYGFRLLPLSLV